MSVGPKQNKQKKNSQEDKKNLFFFHMKGNTLKVFSFASMCSSKNNYIMKGV